MNGLYSLRRKKDEEEYDPMKGPIFPNVPPPLAEPQKIPLEEKPDLLGKGMQLATTLAQAKTAPGTVKTPTGIETPTGTTGTTGTTEVNPYAFWKTPIGGDKEGKGGIPLDLAVTLAGTLASSIAPKEWSGLLGTQLSQLAQSGGKAHESWIESQKKHELEKEKVGIERTRVAKPTEVEIKAGLAGPEARKQFMSAEKAGKAFDVEEFLQTGTSEEISKYLANKVTAVEKLAVASETPTHRQALEAQRDMAKKSLELHGLQVQLEQMKINLTPEDRAMEKAKHEKTMTKLAMEAKSLSAHADLFEAQAKQTGLTNKEGLEDLRASRMLYRQSRLLFEKTWAETAGGGSIKKDQALSILTGTVHDHLMGVVSSARKEVKTREGTRVVPDLKEGNESFGYWLSRIDEEFQTSKKGIVGREQKTGVFGIYGQVTGERVMPAEDVRWQKYAGQLLDFTEILGPDIYPLYLDKSLALFKDIYTVTAPTPRMNNLAERAAVLWETYTGKPWRSLENLIQQKQFGTTGSTVPKTPKPLEMPELGGVP
jgi:hypothetical protein